MNDRKQKKRAKLRNKIAANSKRQLTEAKLEKRLNQLERTQKSQKDDMLAYLQCLLRPAESPGCKIPQPVPIDTSTARLKSIGSVNASANGYLKLVLTPWYLTGVLGTVNDGTLTDTVAGVIGYSNVAPITATHCAAYRVVSAQLKVWCVDSRNTASGLGSMCCPAGVDFVNSSMLNLRDAAASQTGGMDLMYSGIYRPTDPTSQSFVDISSIGHQVTRSACPVFVASGCAANQKFAYDITVNYEFVPKADSLDLLNPTPGWTGMIGSLSKAFGYLANYAAAATPQGRYAQHGLRLLSYVGTQGFGTATPAKKTGIFGLGL